MLPEHGPGVIVELKLLSCKKNSSLLDASFHMSVNQRRQSPWWSYFTWNIYEGS